MEPVRAIFGIGAALLLGVHCTGAFSGEVRETEDASADAASVVTAIPDAAADGPLVVDATADAAQDADTREYQLRMFVTSQPIRSQQLGDIANADHACNEEARSAGLGGVYVAYIAASSAALAHARIEGVPPWWDAQRTQILFHDRPNNPTAKPTAPIPDPFGNVIVPTTQRDRYVWTGTDLYGVTEYTCADWNADNSSLGGANAGCSWLPEKWRFCEDQEPGYAFCGGDAYLYCFEQPPARADAGP